MFKKHQKILKDCGLLLPLNQVTLRKFWITNGNNAYATIFGDDVKFAKTQDAAQFHFLKNEDSVSVAELGSKLFLDIWDNESPSLKVYKKTPSRKQQWILDNESCTIRSTANESISFQVVYVPFTILSMNVAYNVVLNQLDGSEKWFVKLCQKTYNGGMSDVAELSQCTKNAMDMITTCMTKSFDLIGLQEMSSDAPVLYLVDQLKTLKGEDWEYFFASSDGYLVSNVATMGRGRKFTKQGQQTLNTKDERAFCGVWFPSVATVAISMHVGHGYKENLIAELEKFLETTIAKQFLTKSGETSIDVVKHVVIMGDFNYKVIDKEIHAFGKTLQVYGGAKNTVETCCQQGRTLDHIFTSDPSIAPTPLYFGLPPCDAAYRKKINGQQFIMQSDHLAVVSGVESIFL